MKSSWGRVSPYLFFLNLRGETRTRVGKTMCRHKENIIYQPGKPRGKERGTGQIALAALGKKRARDTLSLNARPLDLRDDMFLLLGPPGPCYFVTGVPKKRIHTPLTIVITVLEDLLCVAI